MIAPASRKLGKYEIRQKLGRGGMADVYLAQDTELGHLVALKLIEHSTDADTCASIEAEMRGATLQARLADVDPRVVRVYGAGDMEGFFYVAMEYVDGQDLAELMRHGKLEVEFATDVALAVAQTLDNAHKLEASVGGKNIQGIVHGDIKPKNIRIDARGQARVLDFGIAKALSLSRRLTRNEFGSVPYASPERLESGEVNVGSDLWSLAVMLYEMVTGLQPYQAESTERMERMIRSGIPPPPAPDPCPETLRRILMKAMAPDPEVRYESASSLGMDLAAFRAGGKVQAVAEDLEATRRTFRRPAVDDDTRRTKGEDTKRTVEGQTQTSRVKAPEKPAAPAKQRGDLFYYLMRVVAALVIGCVAYALWAGIDEYRLYQRGQEFQHDVAAEQIADPNQIWDRWTELSKDNPSSIFLGGPRKVAGEKFVAAADHVIDTYRNNDSQPVYENDWQRARTMLLHALSVDPDDKSVKGKLRVCEGHMARINGASHKSAAELNQAVQAFAEAQRLLPQSPDPALGMARVYVALRDVDKAAAAFHQAEVNGYRLGNRERSQLADGYRERADRTFWDARKLRGLPQEKEQVQQAANDYQRALDLYRNSAGWGDSTTRIGLVETSLESVKTRLEQIEVEQGDPAVAKHGKVAGAIIGLIDALRDKSTKKKDEEH
jgi:serine/threonine protein kinase/tetratricopeptide (TPR) repeat protein